MLSSAPASQLDPRRLIVSVAALLLGLLALAGVVDLMVRIGPAVLRPQTGEGTEVVHAVREMGRVMGVALSMLVSLTAIAVPLTANVYTPKLIELFVADRINRVVLGYYVLGNVFVLWNGFVLFDGLDPGHAQARVLACLGVTLLGLLMIVPYVLYVLRLLIPRTIVRGLEGEIIQALSAACRLPKDSPRMPALRCQVVEDVQYLGKVALRSLDRYDRDTALEALASLEDLFLHYQARKPFLPGSWFRPEEWEIQSLGPELMCEAHRVRAGVEVAILLEHSLMLPLAVGRLPEVVAAIATSARRFGVRASESGDKGVREQVTLFFNTFLRTALQRRHPDTFYKFVYQYRRFAEEILERDPAHALRVVFFLDYYGHQAVRSQMGFLINVVAYDLAELCLVGYEKGVACREQLLRAVIDLDRDEVALMELPGVVKAQVILAAQLLTRGDHAAAGVIEQELKKVPREKLDEAFGQIMAATEENFWEIADRRRHLDHVEPRYRPAFERLRENVLGKRLLGVRTRAYLRLEELDPDGALGGDAQRTPAAAQAVAPPPPRGDDPPAASAG
jgi:hypothetical protein